VLDPFAPGGFTNVPDPALQETIDAYNTSDLGGVTPFNANSAAVGYNAFEILDPAVTAPGCDPGFSPIDCEWSQKMPSVVLLSLGTRDAQQGVDAGSFRQRLQEIVDSAEAAGIIPVLMTLPPRADIDAATLLAFNEAIIQVAQSNGLPLLNVARLLNELPNSGLSGDGVTLTVSPSGAGDLSPEAVSQYGVNAVNAALISVLGDLQANFLAP
jgi:hypothetical protein